jgi:HSP20 family protein
LTHLKAGGHRVPIMARIQRTERTNTMAEAATKLPVKGEPKVPTPAPAGWQVFDNMRQEMERMFDDFRLDLGRLPFRRSDLEPFWRREMKWSATPAVDIVEKDDAYEISAELPGMSDKEVDVRYANGMLTISGEKQTEKEEKRKDFHLSERRYGSFQRSFSVPEGVDADKLSATFTSGVLTVVLPKSQEARRKEKKVPISVK